MVSLSRGHDNPKCICQRANTKQTQLKGEIETITYNYSWRISTPFSQQLTGNQQEYRGTQHQKPHGLIHICRTLHHSRIHILFKHLKNIHQDYILGHTANLNKF